MPLLAAITPLEHEVFHTDEIVEPVRFDLAADLVGLTATPPSALHAYSIADEFRRRRVPVVIGGPHATALPDEAAGPGWQVRGPSIRFGSCASPDEDGAPSGGVGGRRFRP